MTPSIVAKKGERTPRNQTTREVRYRESETEPPGKGTKGKERGERAKTRGTKDGEKGEDPPSMDLNIEFTLGERVVFYQT